MLISLSWGVTKPAPTAPELTPWETSTTRPVTSGDRHSIHAYFNTCPESPDGRHIIFFASTDPAGEHGDLIVQERASGRETPIATGIVTEDAHRVACQQWTRGGKTIVWHECRDGRWFVLALDVETLKPRIIAEDRQLAFGAPAADWVPVYGCHWNPGQHTDLQLVNVCTGEIRTCLQARQVLDQYGQWARTTLGEGLVSIFFPVMSPDGNRLFFKLARGNGGNDFRSPNASVREGKFVYDLQHGRLLRMFPQWGHPSWHPDSQRIFEKGNILSDSETGQEQHLALTPTNHPTISPDACYFASDADVSGRDFGKPTQWAVMVARTQGEGFVVVHQFDNTQGATSWRRSHPHPIFSADSRRIYYNVSDGPWTRLFVAETAAAPSPR